MGKQTRVVVFCVILLVVAYWFLVRDDSDKKILIVEYNGGGSNWHVIGTDSNVVSDLRVEDDSFQTVSVVFPGEGIIEEDVFWDLSGVDGISFKIYAGKGSPGDLVAVLFLQDSNDNWLQSEPFNLVDLRWNAVSMNFCRGAESAVSGSCVPLKTPYVEKVGIKFFSNKSFSGDLYVGELKAKILQEPDFFPSVQTNSDTVGLYDLFEIRLFPPQYYPNPFDGNQIKVEGVFTAPDGNTVTVRGFFYQDYQKDNLSYSPKGLPYWLIRYTPVQVGGHDFFVRVLDAGGEFTSKSRSFEVVESNNNGFVRVDEESKKFFRFDSGLPYYPVGINLHSPNDEGYGANKSVIRPQETTILDFYDRMFDKINESGGSYSEVWLSNWNLALEWNKDWPDYYGVGRYSLKNAWLLDEIINSAKKHDIYLQIVLSDHGQFSTYFDSQWATNPYNIDSGGYLTGPEDFFTDNRSRFETKQKYEYLTARWGYSPNVFSWVLMNEINLVGTFGTNISKIFYKDAEPVTSWYENFSKIIKDLDPNDHLVPVQYFSSMESRLYDVDSVDFILSEGYYYINRGDTIISRLNGSDLFYGGIPKPSMVGEFGGSPYAGTNENLDRDFVLGLWGGYHLDFAGAPVLWWHRFIDEHNLYYYLKHFSEYIRPDIGKKPYLKDVQVNISGSGEKNLAFLCKGAFNFTTCFIYDKKTLTDLKGDENFSSILNTTVSVPVDVEGEFVVEFWSMEEGLLYRGRADSDEGLVSVALPSFSKYVAFKVYGG